MWYINNKLVPYLRKSRINQNMQRGQKNILPLKNINNSDSIYCFFETKPYHEWFMDLKNASPNLEMEKKTRKNFSLLND